MFPKQFIYLVLPLSEEPTSDIGRHFRGVNKFVNSAIRRDSANVLVHCSTGNNLAACFVVAYLIKVFDYSVKAAITHVKR